MLIVIWNIKSKPLLISICEIMIAHKFQPNENPAHNPVPSIIPLTILYPIKHSKTPQVSINIIVVKSGSPERFKRFPIIVHLLSYVNTEIIQTTVLRNIFRQYQEEQSQQFYPCQAFLQALLQRQHLYRLKSRT